MRIFMEKRKPGIYAQWYEVLGYHRGRFCYFLIYREQANSYAKAIRFFKEKWPRAYGMAIRNAPPYSDQQLKCA